VAATLEAVAGQIGGRVGGGNRLRQGPIDAGGGEGGAGGGDEKEGCGRQMVLWGPHDNDWEGGGERRV